MSTDTNTAEIQVWKSCVLAGSSRRQKTFFNFYSDFLFFEICTFFAAKFWFYLTFKNSIQYISMLIYFLLWKWAKFWLFPSFLWKFDRVVNTLSFLGNFAKFFTFLYFFFTNLAVFVKPNLHKAFNLIYSSNYP